MPHRINREKMSWRLFFILAAISIGGLAEIVPLFFLSRTPDAIVEMEPLPGMHPYDAIRLEGRDIYLQEGCVGCHSQMIRSLYVETERYGHASVAGESVYDYPVLWGSHRTGPDLARIGGHYSDSWHQEHLRNPHTLVADSIMPTYSWLASEKLEGTQTADKMRAMNTLFALSCPKCIPYTEKEIQEGPGKVRGKTAEEALIAYLNGDLAQPGGLGRLATR